MKDNSSPERVKEVKLNTKMVNLSTQELINKHESSILELVPWP